MTKNDSQHDSTKEVRPPWVVYPQIPPGDSFWKYGGESYMNAAFRPYWKSLNKKEQKDYCIKWNVPEDWLFELDPDTEVREFLEEFDTE